MHLPVHLGRVLCVARLAGLYLDQCYVQYSYDMYIHTRVWAWVTEYMQVSMLVNTMLCFNKRYLHIFNHPRLYPSNSPFV